MGIPRESLTPEVIWAPQDGPQTALLTCPIEEVAFGGARGGGKTDGVLGDWIKHSFDAGRFAAGMMVRRHLTELEETIARSHEIFVPLGARYHTQSKTWTMPWKARLKFRFIERDTDAMLYQGHSYCVAVGTRIAMADGSYRPIEQVAPGDYVATLEGPRRVQATVEPYLAPCVWASVRGGSGEWLGAQRHPVWHPVLTSAGLSASDRFPIPRSAPQRRAAGRAPCKPAAGSPPGAGPAFPAWFAYAADDRSGCTGSSHAPQAGSRPEGSSVPVVLHAPSARLSRARAHDCLGGSTQSRSPHKWRAPWTALAQGMRTARLCLLRLALRARSWPGLSCLCLPSATAYAPTGWRQGLSSPAGYPSGHGCGGERAQPWTENGQGPLPSPADAGSTPLGLPSGEWGTTPAHSRPGQRSWVHPYTGEERDLAEPVVSGTMELTPCGMAWVTDLSVEGANHYISECGLINKNTRLYVEEAGNFPRFEPIQKLFATLRSAHAVRVGMRLTANPGGPGHQWFKTRYISPAPLGYKILTETWPSGRQTHRIFIPSLVTDNRILMSKDPGYVDRLHMVGSPELVRAWLFGDWDIVAGAYFHHWSPEMLIPSFVPPPAWPRFMSMDWGSAKPFSIHWWAVSDGMPITVGKRVLWLPRGALVCYREWYGMKPGQPNVGLKLDAEQIADGIMKREAAAGEYPEEHNPMKTHIRYRVADPSMWKEEGGPSLAERMGKYRPGWDKIWQGVFMRPADNARLAGWDQVHSRMRGFDGIPMMYFMDHCEHAIRTIPTLQHDEIKMEDLDTEAEDHAADDIRYGAMSRPMPAEAPPLRSKPSPFTFDEVVKHG